MRFPTMPYMDRVMGDQPCSILNYINSHKPQESSPVDKIHYIFKADNTFRKYNDVLAFNQDGVRPSTFGVDLANQTFDSLDSGDVWKNQVAAMVADLSVNKTYGFNKLMKWDNYSVRAYLVEEGGYTQGEVDWMETVNDATGHYDFYSLTQAVLEQWVFTSSDINNWTAINGGMDKLTNGMYDLLKEKPVLNSRVTQITNNTDGTMNLVVNGTTQTYAHIISTVPLGALQTIKMTGLGLDYFQKKAIRTLQ